MLLVLLALTGCIAKDFKIARPSKEPAADIQERLSSVIARNGFDHSLRSDRKGGHHDDSIYIKIPLDSLKRQHYSLENMVRDVGVVCSLPEYADLSFRIEFTAGDNPDRLYLQQLLLKEFANRTNVAVSVEADYIDDILIMTSHKAR